jgi:ABC-2 type transport system permease protein
VPARVFFKTLRDARWQIFWYGVGLASMAALVVYIYPPYSEQLADFEIPEAFRAFFGEAEWSTPAGFLGTEFFGNWVPALIVVFGIMQGTNALAGEEVNGTMDVLLAQPVSRARLLIEKMVGFVIATLLILSMVGIGWLLSIPFVEEMDVPMGRVLGATYGLLPLAAAFYAFSLWLSVALPTRGAATGIAAVVAVFTFFAYTLSLVVDLLKPMQWLSPFFYYDGTGMVVHGVTPWKMSLLVVSWAAFSALALVAFDRREISVRQVESRLFRLPFRPKAA